MGSNGFFYLGILCGLIVGVVVIVIRRRKSGRVMCEFDERQELARGKAFQYGFYALLLYLLFYGLVEDMTGVYWGKGMTGVALGICIGVGVFAAVSIWNDAYFSLWERPKRFIVLFSVVMVSNLYLGISHLQEPEQSPNYGYINLFLGITFLEILLVMGAKALKNRRESEEE